MPERRMLAAIVFTDIEGYTRLMHEREALALESLKVHNKVFDELAFKYSGLVVKSIGDSYLIEFPSAVNAVQCALDAQDAFAKRNADLPDAYRLKVRISIHVGDVVMDNDDVYGDGVNIASRLQSVTPGGAICLSREAYAQIKTKLGRRFVSLGTVPLKGLPEPIEVFLNKEAAPAVEGAVKVAPISVVLPDTPPQVAPESPSAAARPFGPGERQASAADAPLPDPPPPPVIGPSGPTVSTYLIFGALFAVFFGKPWLSVVHADWLSCGWAAALGAAALMQAEDLSTYARTAGAVLVAGAVLAFYQLGGGREGFTFEIALFGGLGVVIAIVAVYLGLVASQPDRRLAGSLLIAATALLTVAGCARAMPDGADLWGGLPVFLRGQLSELAASGGAWRWAGLTALYAAWRLGEMSSFDPAAWSRGAKSSDGRRLNWNL